jgi:hydroxymethylglutaryl-CoA lyase
MEDRILVNEVAPRDGLQNQPVHLSVGEKLELIGALVDAGILAIEATSFVSPKAVPQLADADRLFPLLPESDRVAYSALVPNVRGLERAVLAGVREIAVVLSATDTMNLRNINMSLEQARQACIDTLVAATGKGLRKKAYVAVAFSCPFEGKVAPGRVLDLAGDMFLHGAEEVVIADSIGAANPKEVGVLLAECVERFGESRISAHLHDTRGFALANAWAALSAGVRRFDSSIGGLGGCPFAPGAAGNLATEDLVVLADQCGFRTGIDLPRLRKAVVVAERLTQRKLGGRITAWLRSEDARCGAGG